MKLSKINVDINAHLHNISSIVSIRNNNVEAKVSFTNYGRDTITTVKFKAIAYNSLNEIIKINNKETFFLLVEDIKVKKNKTISDIIIPLPDTNIKSLFLQEYRIYYENGDIVTYKGHDVKEFIVEEYENNEEDAEMLSALQYKYGEYYKYKPLENSHGWICCCGHYNKHDNKVCSYCDNHKDEIFKTRLPSVVDDIIQEYNEKSIFSTLINKHKKYIKHIIAGFCAFLVIFILSLSLLLSHNSFESETEMKDALLGTYTYYDEEGNASKQIVIKSDQITYKWKYQSSELDVSIKEWNFEEGLLITNSDTITIDGDSLIIGEDTYKKGGHMATYDNPENTNLDEIGSHVLRITSSSLTTNSKDKICAGTLKNYGNKTYKNIKLKAVFKDSKGSILNENTVEVVKDEGLLPNGTVKFKISVPKDHNIKEYTVTIYDYQIKEIE